MMKGANTGVETHTRSMADQELISAIEAEGNSLFRQLVTHAFYKAMAWSMPPEYTAEDLVQIALERAVRGTRNWNRDQYDTVLEFLKSVVDSIAYERTRSKRGSESAQTISLDEDPEDHTIDEALARDRREALFEIVGDDVVLFVVLEGRLGGLTRSQIAAENGMTPEDVTNATKRLYRKVREELDQSLLFKDWRDHVAR